MRAAEAGCAAMDGSTDGSQCCSGEGDWVWDTVSVQAWDARGVAAATGCQDLQVEEDGGYRKKKAGRGRNHGAALWQIL